MACHTHVFRISEATSRQLRAFMDSGGHGYESPSEFVEVAIANQLALEEDAARTTPARSQARSVRPSKPPAAASPREAQPEARGEPPEFVNIGLLVRPTVAPPTLAQAQLRTDEPLHHMCNRLSPIKVAVRVLANMASPEVWPDLRAFHEKSSAAARHVGLMLRSKESAESVRRRSVAYPVGSDERKAKDRYISSFTLQVAGDRISGPLATLGLAALLDSRIALTAAGWQLAAASSPVLGEVPGWTLSEEEMELFREQLRLASAEWAAIDEFLAVVHRAGGVQRRVDELLNVKYRDWTADRVIAARAAMAGRLSDLRVIEIHGRGPAATITLLPAGKLYREVREETEV